MTATEQTVLFGDKNNFAIELAYTKNPRKFKLGFWLENKRLGNFSKSGELKYSVREYWKFVNNKEFYYLHIFDGMSPKQIFDYLLDWDLINSTKKEDIEEAERRQKFYVFFWRPICQSNWRLFITL